MFIILFIFEYHFYEFVVYSVAYCLAVLLCIVQRFFYNRSLPR